MFRASKISNGSFLMPSFLQSRNKSKNERVSRTAWLDGMRGLAAFFVYIRHFASATHPNIQVGFGANPDNRYLIQLPILHLLTAGPAMVALFFIISGYALSWGPLRAIHNQSASACLQRLSSATFRRAARLFLPGVASTFIVMLCVSAGLYDRGHASINSDDMPGFMEPEPPMFRTEPFIVQLRDWVNCTWSWLQIWNSGGHPYDAHLWTLPVEFRCSMILFMALVGFARTPPRIRLGLLLSCIVYCHYTNFWEGWLFFAGSFLAQMKLMQDEGAEEANMILINTIVTANNAPGYRTISTFCPPHWPENWRFPHCVGAFLTVYATSSTSTATLRSLFDNPVSVYLGKISYALYLVHGPVVHMLGFWLIPWFWAITGKETMLQKEIGFGAGFAIATLCVIWSADLFCRGVDWRCVAFAKWAENLVIVAD
ncbi:hypothetical protein EJ08DRAFT_671449 [Tothia fuscella]|uniref:Acyltransferase 3 domain-containing protein n=1 Tax=Tothia fuscella TaxID=1048955 RepID=A0A9P4NNE7_9PEZI|nr:hypothetical protein EJ08DRAFT_671449 [Tothia fuscella]